MFLPSDPAAYGAASAEVMSALREVDHPVEVWGWDEAFVRLLGVRLELAPPVRTAEPSAPHAAAEHG